MSLLEVLFAPQAWPFEVALILLVAVVVIEAVGLVVGLSPSGWLAHLLPDDGAGLESLSDSWLGWLHVGRLPLLALFVILLTAFVVIGYALLFLAHGLFGALPPAALGATLAAFGAVPALRVVGGWIARITPRDESSAVRLESLIGRVAVVVNGTARQDYPAEARVKNEHGQTMYVRVEPDRPEVVFGPGQAVLLSEQISGSRFRAIANPRPDLL